MEIADLKIKKGREWFRLDNAAKIYPSASNKVRTAVFRISFELDQAVRIKELQEALSKTLDDLPYFRSELKKGFFWYWLESSTIQPLVQLDEGQPCRKFNVDYKNHLLMRILAKKNLVSGEFMHVLSDGFGALIFMLSMLKHYGEACGWQVDPLKDIIDLNKTREEELYEDSYKRHFKKHIPHPVKLSKAYHLPFRLTRNPEFKVLFAEVNSKSLLEQVKEEGVTLTVYLGAVYLYCLQTIYLRQYKEKKKHKRPIIRVEIPINLRNFFDSKTLRNFALFVMPEIDARLGPYSFSEIVKIVHHYMQLETDKKQIQRIIARNVGSEKNILIRAIPLTIKVFILKMVYKRSGPNLYSGVITNMGKMQLAENCRKHIKGIRIIAPPPDPLFKINSALISYGNKMVLTFGNLSESKEFEQLFIAFLQEKGIAIKILND